MMWYMLECMNCKHRWEVRGRYVKETNGHVFEDLIDCPRCGSEDTLIDGGGVGHDNKQRRETMRGITTKLLRERLQRTNEVDPMTYEPISLNLEGIDCQEASPRSVSTYIMCGAPAEALVWHEKDKRVYPMCKACAWHNLRNRGGRLLAGDRRLTR
jgi:hypothetical protein